MSYLVILMVRLVLEVLGLHLVLGVRGFLGAPRSHLLPGGLTDPADPGNRYPRPPVHRDQHESSKPPWDEEECPL